MQYFKYKTYFAFSIHSNTLFPLTDRDGLSIEGWRALLSLVMYGICSNKALYSASFSFTMFIGPAAVAQQVLQNRACLSLTLSECLLKTGSLVFPNFGIMLETQITLCMTEPDFFRKTSFAPNTGKMGQNWTKNRVF